MILKMRIEVSYTPTRSPRQINANFIYKKTARSSQKQPEAARSSQKQPEAARSSQEQPGAARSSQSRRKQPEAARSRHEQPGAAKGSQKLPEGVNKNTASPNSD